MSDEMAIRLRGVSKRYPRYARPADRLKTMLFRNDAAVEYFTALKEVSLEVPRGHTVGIVGRNGSGKSTLLQVVAGTLTPTEGTAEVKGRVSALLELGSGFSPEFTGRENVYFQGQVLGCSREYLDEKFEAIAAFADIGEFIEQPLKTYSSGMMVRLAFAVAISVDPDVLIVDEALAVGDEAFQRKCFARIGAIQEQGGTILFVSHSGSHIIELCDRAVLLDGGEKLLEGEPKVVVANYHKLLFARGERHREVRAELLAGRGAAGGVKAMAMGPAGEEPQEDFLDAGLVPQSTIRYHAHGAEIRDARICRAGDGGRDGAAVNVLVRGREYVYRYEVHFAEAASRVRCGMLIKTMSGYELGGATTHPYHRSIDYVAAGSVLAVSFRFRCSVQAGVYFMNAGVMSGTPEGEMYLHRVIDAVMFRVPAEAESCLTATVDFGIEPSVTGMNDER
jgi:lipopolysaccharide transport system ATP-binding protein